jgi:uncharacterized peroxidase-related enzyme
MFIDPVPEESAVGALAEFYQQQKSAWGFLPNFAAAFSTRPQVARAWSLLNKTVREGMDRRRFEIATIGAARALRSTYCTAAHAKFLRDVCGDELTVIAIAEDPSGEGLDEQDRAVYNFAGQVARDASSIQQHDVDALRELGLTDVDVADIVFAAAARSFFTRVLDGLGAQLDVQTAERRSLQKSSPPWWSDDLSPPSDLERNCHLGADASGHVGSPTRSLHPGSPERAA